MLFKSNNHTYLYVLHMQNQKLLHLLYLFLYIVIIFQCKDNLFLIMLYFFLFYHIKFLTSHHYIQSLYNLLNIIHLNLKLCFYVFYIRILLQLMLQMPNLLYIYLNVLQKWLFSLFTNQPLLHELLNYNIKYFSSY